MAKGWGKLVGLLILFTVGVVLALDLRAEAKKKEKVKNEAESSLVVLFGPECVSLDLLPMVI